MYELIGKKVMFPDTEENRNSIPFKYNHVIPNKVYEVIEYSNYPSAGCGPRVRCEDNTLGDIPMQDAKWILVEDKPELNKYSREIKPGVFVDVYDVLRAFKVVDPCLQHMAKKVLAVGQRHHKDEHEDLKDILASAKRALEMFEEFNKEEQDGNL